MAWKWCPLKFMRLGSSRWPSAAVTKVAINMEMTIVKNFGARLVITNDVVS